MEYLHKSTGNIYYVPKLENEIQEQFNIRINLIFSQNVDNLNKFNEMLKISRCWYNYYFLKCSYRSELENKIIKFNDGINIID